MIEQQVIVRRMLAGPPVKVVVGEYAQKGKAS